MPKYEKKDYQNLFPMPQHRADIYLQLVGLILLFMFLNFNDYIKSTDIYKSHYILARLFFIT